MEVLIYFTIRYLRGLLLTYKKENKLFPIFSKKGDKTELKAEACNQTCQQKETGKRQSGAIQSLSHVRLCVTPWTVAHQAPLSVGSSRQEYWSGLPCPPPGDLPDSETEPASPACRRTLCHWASREAQTETCWLPSRWTWTPWGEEGACGPPTTRQQTHVCAKPSNTELFLQ